jgi:hypothetical protein
MSIAAAAVKPNNTEWETNATRRPRPNRPKQSWVAPTKTANRIAIWKNFKDLGVVIPDIELKTIADIPVVGQLA